MKGKTFPWHLGLLALLLAFCLPEARAQVAIYRLEFSHTGPSVNYGFYREAWVVVDAAGGPATWLLAYRDGAHNRFIQAPGYGSYFLASKRGQLSGVIHATPATGTPASTFLLLGALDAQVKSQVATVKVAKALEGYALSADSENELPFSVNEIDKGYAGFSRVRATLQASDSAEANHDGLTVEEAAGQVAASLKRRGFQDATPASPAPTTSAEAQALLEGETEESPSPRP